MNDSAVESRGGRRGVLGRAASFPLDRGGGGRLSSGWGSDRGGLWLWVLGRPASGTLGTRFVIILLLFGGATSLPRGCGGSWRRSTGSEQGLLVLAALRAPPSALDWGSCRGARFWLVGVARG